MKLLEIRNQLVSHFMKVGDTFSLNDDLKSIRVDKKQEKYKRELVQCAFQLLEESKFVAKCVVGDNVIYGQECAVGENGQTIEISSYTGETIARIINDYREALNIKEGAVDALAVNEDNLQMLIQILVSLLNNVEKKNQE